MVRCCCHEPKDSIDQKERRDSGGSSSSSSSSSPIRSSADHRFAIRRRANFVGQKTRRHRLKTASAAAIFKTVNLSFSELELAPRHDQRNQTVLEIFTGREKRFGTYDQIVQRGSHDTSDVSWRIAGLGPPSRSDSPTGSTDLHRSTSRSGIRQVLGGAKDGIATKFFPFLPT